MAEAFSRWVRSRSHLENLSPEEQAAYFEARGGSTGPETLRDMIAKAGTTDAVLPDDEIPEGWLDEAGPTDAGGRTGRHADVQPE